MTLEQAIIVETNKAREWQEYSLPDKGDNIHALYAEWLKELKALKEQEPCEDAVSRQAVLEQTYFWSRDEFLRVAEPFDFLRKKINSLPPVTPQPKIAHWMDDKCSACGKGIEDLISSREWYKNEEPKFCPFCGKKFEESEK